MARHAVGTDGGCLLLATAAGMAPSTVGNAGARDVAVAAICLGMGRSVCAYVTYVSDIRINYV